MLLLTVGTLTWKSLQSPLDNCNELVLLGEVSLQFISHDVLSKDLLQDVSFFTVVTHPLLAALARNLDQSGVGTAQVG